MTYWRSVSIKVRKFIDQLSHCQSLKSDPTKRNREESGNNAQAVLFVSISRDSNHLNAFHRRGGVTDLRAYARGGGTRAGEGAIGLHHTKQTRASSYQLYLASDEIWIERARRDVSPAHDKNGPPSKTSANSFPSLTNPIRGYGCRILKPEKSLMILAFFHRMECDDGEEYFARSQFPSL